MATICIIKISETLQSKEYIGIIGTAIGVILGFWLTIIKEMINTKIKKCRVIRSTKQNIKLLIKKQEHISDCHFPQNATITDKPVPFLKETSANLRHYYNLYENSLKDLQILDNKTYTTATNFFSEIYSILFKIENTNTAYGTIINDINSTKSELNRVFNEIITNLSIK